MLNTIVCLISLTMVYLIWKRLDSVINKLIYFYLALNLDLVELQVTGQLRSQRHTSISVIASSYILQVLQIF
jgi:hypothetical protein